MTANVIGKKQATKLLQSASKEFIDDFLSAYDGAIPLRSKEPGLCWKMGGQVAFVALQEFSGPNTMEEDSPLLTRLRTNLYPPPAIFYHLKSPAVRQKLGLSDNPLLATEPALEVTARPDEVCKLGRWLTMWLDSQLYQHPSCPAPPVPLLAWNVHEELRQTRDDITTVGPDWRYNLYLWTPNALEEFEKWLNQ